MTIYLLGGTRDSKSTDPADLKLHKNQHQKENPFSCTQCASKFMTPVDLKIHENQDQSEKPFSCTQCAST